MIAVIKLKVTLHIIQVLYIRVILLRLLLRWRTYCNHMSHHIISMLIKQADIVGAGSHAAMTKTLSLRNYQ